MKECCCLLAFLFLVSIAPATAQSPVGLEEGNIEVITEAEPVWCRPGVKYRSQSRGVSIRYEQQPDFTWDGGEGIVGGKQRVTRLEQFTFKFKVPLVNKPRTKVLLGYEWDTEKYYFNDPGEGFDDQTTLFQLLDERRLKANKLSGYVTHALNRERYLSGRVRMSLNGDYQGLISFDNIYRTYSAAIVYGKKVDATKEWAIGMTLSHNKARTIGLPFFVYNKTFNERWGIQTALPGQAFLRRNVGAARENNFLLGATFDSRYYAINTGSRPGFERLGQYFLRNNGIRTMLQYEHNIAPWVWGFAQGGYYIPVNNRFNPEDDIDLDIHTRVGARPFFRVGVFVTPPRGMIN